jgi:hypothetical protein
MQKKFLRTFAFFLMIAITCRPEPLRAFGLDDCFDEKKGTKEKKMPGLSVMKMKGKGHKQKKDKCGKDKKLIKHRRVQFWKRRGIALYYYVDHKGNILKLCDDCDTMKKERPTAPGEL